MLASLWGSELELETGRPEALRGLSLQIQLAAGLLSHVDVGSSPRAAFSLRSGLRIELA